MCSRSVAGPQPRSLHVRGDRLPRSVVEEGVRGIGIVAGEERGRGEVPPGRGQATPSSVDVGRNALEPSRADKILDAHAKGECSSSSGISAPSRTDVRNPERSSDIQASSVTITGFTSTPSSRSTSAAFR